METFDYAAWAKMRRAELAAMPQPATEPCEACHGTGCGHVGECMIDEPCEECNGEGKVEVDP